MYITWPEALHSLGIGAEDTSVTNSTNSVYPLDFDHTTTTTTSSPIAIGTSDSSSITIGTSDLPSTDYSHWSSSSWTAHATSAPVSPADLECAKQEAKERCETMRREFGKDLLVVLEACRMLLIDGAPLEEKVSTIEELQSKLMEAYNIKRVERDPDVD